MSIHKSLIGVTKGVTYVLYVPPFFIIFFYQTFLGVTYVLYVPPFFIIFFYQTFLLSLSFISKSAAKVVQKKTPTASLPWEPQMKKLILKDEFSYKIVICARRLSARLARELFGTIGSVCPLDSHLICAASTP